MRYIINLPNPNNHLINICLEIENINTSDLELQLPAWRPGRYEIGNFAKNIQSLKVKDKDNNSVPSIKITKDRWRIETKNVSSIKVEYNYYAYELNAGSCFFTNEQLYVNGIQCFLYNPQNLNQNHEVKIKLPDDWIIACSLKNEGNVLIAKDFHELVDSPFIVSPTLIHKQYTIENINFHIWVQGQVNFDWDRILTDFKKFTAYQLKVMGSFPVSEYHFLVQSPNSKAYHGVEHLANTVLYFGPASSIMEDKNYNEFLGLSSHELFHSWNIKAIRPIEWYPYDYEKENYSRLGYVAEGVTTYIGDKFLFSSGVFDANQYLKELSNQVQKHVDNFGRFFMPVTQASMDTWLDGYELGVPHRKTSIYTEGALITFMLDLLIMKHSGFKNSIESVMKNMYKKYALKNKGYSEQDYINECQTEAEVSLKTFFETFVYGADSFEFELSKLFDWIGLKLVYSNSNIVLERFGIKSVKKGNGYYVIMVAPDSPAEHEGISQKDIIKFPQSLNNLNNDELNNLMEKEGHSISVILATDDNNVKNIKLTKHSGTEYYRKVKLELLEKRSAQQIEFFEKWSRVKQLENISQ